MNDVLASWNAMLHAGIFGVLLAVVAIGIGIFLVHQSRRRDSAINLDDLIIDPITNRVDKAAFIFLCSFIFAIWMMVFITTKGQMTEGYFERFLAAFVAPMIAKIIWDKRPSKKTVEEE